MRIVLKPKFQLLVIWKRRLTAGMTQSSVTAKTGDPWIQHTERVARTSDVEAEER
jgi:hypothetical protein